MAVYHYKSIANIMKMLMITLREISPELSLKPVRTEAVVRARKRLGFEPLKTMFELMSEGIKIRPTFHGFRIWTIDGVSFTMTDTVANEKAFGHPPSHRSTAAFPQMQAVALISADPAIYPVVCSVVGTYSPAAENVLNSATPSCLHEKVTRACQMAACILRIQWKVK